jgi:hypothetical protein
MGRSETSRDALRAEFKAQWFAEMREHGIPDDKAQEIWDAGERVGVEASEGCA